MGGIGSHQSANSFTEEWITPREILQPLGNFDLDPCAPVLPPWPVAKRSFNIQTNGLAQDWPREDRVFLNPPYGDKIVSWMRKAALHNNAIALVFARTETDWFQSYVFPCATALYFIRARLNFHHVDGKRSKYNSGAPSVLISYGLDNAHCLAKYPLPGYFVRLRERTQEIPV